LRDGLWGWTPLLQVIIRRKKCHCRDLKLQPTNPELSRHANHSATTPYKRIELQVDEEPLEDYSRELGAQLVNDM